MTDTVNVPRELLERLVAWINREVPVPTRSATRWAMDITDLLAAAPKVEQEPVGKVVGADFNSMTTTVHWSAWPVNIGASVYTHPAPASDELLEAIAKDASERVHKNGGCVPQLAYAPILFALQDALTSGAKS